MPRFDSPPPPAFGACVFAGAGWALMAAWLVDVHAGARMHGVAAAFALWLLVLGLRCRWPARTRHGWRAQDAGAALVLLLLGAGIGLLVLRAQALPLALAGAAACCLPWPRLALCRYHVATACASVWLGLGATLAAGRQGIAPAFLPLAGWALWICACVDVLWRIERSWRIERASGRLLS